MLDLAIGEDDSVNTATGHISINLLHMVYYINIMNSSSIVEIIKSQNN